MACALRVSRSSRPASPPNSLLCSATVLIRAETSFTVTPSHNYGQTGIQSSQTHGTLQSYGYGATYSGTTTYSPSYGITGWTPKVGTRRLYTRAIALHIYDISQGDEPVRLYESIVTSEGSSGTLGEVIDEIVASLFEDLRATGVRTTSVPMNP